MIDKMYRLKKYLSTALIYILIIIQLLTSATTNLAEVFAMSLDQINYEELTSADLYSIAKDIIEWKKGMEGKADEWLFSGSYLEKCATSEGDWYVIAMERYGMAEDYTAYLAKLASVVKEKYEKDGTLSNSKATEYHRITLAALSAGGNPKSIAELESGEAINLIKDGVYDRGYTAQLGKQGINGWIWGLIALDTLNYEIPSNSYYTREDIIKNILCLELENGGFSLVGDKMDVEITAMAIQSLAPYYNEAVKYTYDNINTGKTVTASVKEIIDRAVIKLSEAQLDNGDFDSYGGSNAETNAQVMIALCALDINPVTDERFIKNGNTILDSMLRYRTEDGGFAHYIDKNGNKEADSVAGVQVLLALNALIRQWEGMNRLYDFTSEDRTISEMFEEDINGVKEEITGEDLEFIRLNENKITTEYENRVVTLISIAEAVNANEECLESLYKMQENYKKAKLEIENINDIIEKELYPLEEISIEDKKVIDEITQRYNKLSDYDKKKILYYEDVERAAIIIEGKIRSYIIGVVAVIVILVLILTVCIRIRKRVKAKKAEDWEE